ncbi:MAG: LysM peptidoglycan-binding domain-containing protein [Bacteroidetes bacterium]|nr:LysM peptidoglycan-binding domain-containing protein [Bacteroidota bacterium]
MKRVALTILWVLALGAFPLTVFAQDDDCCPEEDKYGREDELLINEWQKQMYDLSDKKEQLLLQIQKYNSEIDALKKESADMDKKTADAENELFASVGSDRNGVAEFRKKFDETEKKINNKLGTPADARKSYFNEIEASKIKCLPEFYNRYLAMKSKLEAWEKESVVKSNQYTVVKGDCLWKIAGMKEIYGKNNYWPKIWEANEKGVISAPKNTPKTIVNPNLIYPGQVLKIPVLSEDDLKALKDVKYQVSMQKKASEQKLQKDKSKFSLKKKDIKKEIKNNVKKDDKKDLKKEIKKDTKK